MQHLSIPSISDPILTKLFGAHFLGVKHFFDQHFVGPKLLRYKIISTQNYLGPKILLGFKNFWTNNYSKSKIFLTTILFYPKFSFTQKFWGPKLFEFTIFWTNNFFAPQFFWTYQTDFSLLNPNITNKTIQFSWVLTQLKLI